MSLFLRELGQSSPPRGSGPAAAEAAMRLRSWGSQMELADVSAGGIIISRSSAADESKQVGFLSFKRVISLKPPLSRAPSLVPLALSEARSPLN